MIKYTSRCDAISFTGIQQEPRQPSIHLLSASQCVQRGWAPGGRGLGHSGGGGAFGTAAA